MFILIQNRKYYNLPQYYPKIWNKFNAPRHNSRNRIKLAARRSRPICGARHQSRALYSLVRLRVRALRGSRIFFPARETVASSLAGEGDFCSPELARKQRTLAAAAAAAAACTENISYIPAVCQRAARGLVYTREAVELVTRALFSGRIFGPSTRWNINASSRARCLTFFPRRALRRSDLALCTLDFPGYLLRWEGRCVCRRRYGRSRGLVCSKFGSRRIGNVGWFYFRWVHGGDSKSQPITSKPFLLILLVI